MPVRETHPAEALSRNRDKVLPDKGPNDISYRPGSEDPGFLENDW